LKKTESPQRDLWPWAIAIGLFLVVLVNVVFAWVAVRGFDGVVDSYRTEAR
jgi:hypothetical protein